MDNEPKQPESEKDKKSRRSQWIWRIVLWTIVLYLAILAYTTYYLPMKLGV